MARRHVNNSVVSTFVPGDENPCLEDGPPVDFVHNPLGVPSRMNVGQILETHLGWACAGLGKQVGEAVNAYLKAKSTKPLREKLSEIYSSKTEIMKLADEEVIELGENLRRGVPVATPV